MIFKTFNKNLKNLKYIYFMKVFRFILLIFLFTPFSCFSQTTVTDSMEAALKATVNNTQRIELLCNLSDQFLYTDTIKAKKYLNEATQLAKKSNDNYLTGLVHYALGCYIFTKETSGDKPKIQFITAIQYFDKAHTDKALLAKMKCLYEIGNINMYNGQFDTAFNYMFTVVKFVEPLQSLEAKITLSNVYNSIGAIYHYLKEEEKGLIYKLKALRIYESLEKKDHNMAMLYLQTAYIYVMLEKPKETMEYLQKGKQLLNILNDDAEGMMQYYEVLSKYYLFLKDIKNSLEAQKKAVEQAEKIGNASYLATQKYMLARCYFDNKQYQNAKPVFLECIPLAEHLGDNRIKLKLFSLLTDCEEKSGNTDDALKYLKLHVALNDSLNYAESQSYINELDKKYQTAKKEKEIILLEKGNQSRNFWIYGLMSALLLLIFISVIVFRYMNQQKTIAEQESIKLKQEKTINATNAMLQGEEAERTRLARDLHDGLGGLLSGVKFQLNTMKGNVILNENDALVFNNSISQLDNAIAEMRRVAHNMMPESLINFGLNDALRSYCENIKQTKVLNVTYQSLAMEERLDKSTEVVVYRIVQELLNNIIKHAQATEATIQLSRNNNLISLTVEDNGKGFDMNTIESYKGIGLQNLQNRVDYLNGKMDMKSDSKGTSVLIEFELKS